ncbi:T9SS type A sorting domain-containing protein [Lacibacter luteus]|uniref:T9SS type A sorting domain-containing protein n=1 Tax=Lacibacter luteus TaxID=2508719 RepID=A0A4Q1CNR2_9BACT|nr:T9SS type A sorting domain-containing protein [Lacibacter luteus]RXK62777.1 T9SS type A sorting domain-containing protein [Lacibacter luteus]
MIRKLLLLLVVVTAHLQNTYAQGAEMYANCFWQSASNRIVVRLALRNPTGSSTGQMKFVGMRFGFQYNPVHVNYVGYQSYMTSLNDPSYLSFIGPDTGDAPSDDDSPSSRSAYVQSTGQYKTMNRKYINRSTSVCTNAIPIPSGSMIILLDIYFTLVSRQPSYYHLTDPDYGFGDNEFIAQLLDKWSVPNNNPHNAYLSDDFKDIAIIVNRISNSQEPYQPFDASNCELGNFNPISIGKEDANFITPINGVLAGKAVDANVADKSNHVEVQWKSENNQLIDYFEVQRKDNNGDFKTIGLVMGTDNTAEEKYEYKDKITVRDVESSYRIKAVGKDKITTYSNVQKIRLSSGQSLTVKLYPNPTSDIVRISLPEQNGIYVCRMYSTEGRMVLTSNVSSSNPSVNIKALQTGSYFMELYQPKTGMRYYTQFTKQ